MHVGAAQSMLNLLAHQVNCNSNFRAILAFVLTLPVSWDVVPVQRVLLPGHMCPFMCHVSMFRTTLTRQTQKQCIFGAQD